ncbi:MAG: hypothetical protein QOE61_3102 [Micromonosporaceae bacterium]|nr:hypothetical protein [Micromonosporaceae bacterium]
MRPRRPWRQRGRPQQIVHSGLPQCLGAACMDCPAGRREDQLAAGAADQIELLGEVAQRPQLHHVGLRPGGAAEPVEEPMTFDDQRTGEVAGLGQWRPGLDGALQPTDNDQ